jgi:hypothetical protein
MGKRILDEILARLAALEAAAFGRPRRRLSKGELAKAEGCSTRQVMRKVEQKILPPPDDVTNGRLFWWLDSIEQHRRERARAEADSPAARRARNPGLRPRKPTQTSPES